MIINLKKYLFIGAKEDIEEFFARSQQQGFVEYISFKKKKAVEPSREVKNLLEAIKILRKQPVKTPYLEGGDLAYADEIATNILNLKIEIEKLSEEKRFLEAEIERVGPLGNFSLEDVTFIEEYGGRKIQFFCVKSVKSEELDYIKELIYIGTEYDLDYFLSISKESKHYPGMIEMRFEHIVGELKNHLAFVSESLHQLEAELKGFAGHLPFLREALIHQMNRHSLFDAKKTVSYPIEQTLFAIEGWVPENKVVQLLELTEGLAIHAEPIKVEAEDRVPTYMENKGTPRIGEDIVRIYDIPSHRDLDPSNWVLWSFALFFAMIVSDGGYGLIYLCIAAFFRWKFPNLKGTAKRFLRMFTILAAACFIWGLLTGAFFGIQFNPEGKLTQYSLLQYLSKKKAEYHFENRDAVYQSWVQDDPALARARSGEEMLFTQVSVSGKEEYVVLNEYSDNILLELSILIGVIHISCSLIRYARRNWANIGWVLFAVGGYLYFPTIINATSMVQFLGVLTDKIAGSIGSQLMYVGIALAVILALIQKRWKGIGEITSVIQVFGDVLSYLRLYALGLASTVMARTFNGLGADVGFVIFGAIIILVGHGVNIILGIVAGVIHGLRLNFIEWYHYSFEGGGRLFNPLRKLGGDR